jgi:hypothetical protein
VSASTRADDHGSRNHDGRNQDDCTCGAGAAGFGFDFAVTARGVATTRVRFSGFDFGAQGAAATRVGVSACPAASTDEKFAIAIRLGTVMAENGSGSSIAVVVLSEFEEASFSDTVGAIDFDALATMDTLISSTRSSSFSGPSFFAEVAEGLAAGA